MRVLGLNLSLTSPGFAVIEVPTAGRSAGKPRLIAAANFTTDSSTGQALRYEEIEAFALLFIRDHKPFDVITREIWPPARNFVQNDKIHGCWSAVDRALARYGYEVTVNMTPSNVKKTVTGDGSAKKDKVAASVRKLLNLGEDYAFNSDDCSDAAAIALAYLIREGLIKT